ncbi:TIGR04197 family type VII secretion effector [Streptococcus oricebi]|uniref:TIGR04197 family type VII secretion effector n=1 Tax=Streptococcus oricebi TaxID=1547447 RepID=A0ABS5B4J1_9STRE|nr:TIGR04197 family type VII secretion effector [Streptococcus oricebi]MBP2623754.1 TIGR04197 family type VII secretion effector [Streptococcus oricebi]
MVEIKSNGSIVRGHATRLQTAGRSLSGLAAIQKDSLTTMQGNSNAQQHVEFLSSLAGKIGGALSTASTNLQSAASEFEASDQAAASSIKGE